MYLLTAVHQSCPNKITVAYPGELASTTLFDWVKISLRRTVTIPSTRTEGRSTLACVIKYASTAMCLFPFTQTAGPLRPAQGLHANVPWSAGSKQPGDRVSSEPNTFLSKTDPIHPALRPPGCIQVPARHSLKRLPRTRWIPRRQVSKLFVSHLFFYVAVRILRLHPRHSSRFFTY